MTVPVVEQSPAPARTGLAIVDCDIHPSLRRAGDLDPWLPARWRRHLETFGNHFRQPFVAAPTHPKTAPALARRDAWPPGGGPPGSDLAFVQEQHLDPNGVEHGLLYVLSPNGASQRDVDFGAALCRAVNEWQLAEWTGRDARLRASIMIAQEDPHAAVAEIERWAGCPDFAQVAMSPRAFAPAGQRRYWPVYEAAAAHGLPVAMHIGGHSGYPDTASGHDSYYMEWHQSHAASMQALVTSLVFEGVLERFPALQVVLTEGGFAWLPPLVWRLDALWARLREEVPHVPRPPSDYVRRNVWLTTQPVDEPERPGQLRDVIEWIGWDRLLLSTDYPHWDYDDPVTAFRLRMSDDERARLFRENARALYGLG